MSEIERIALWAGLFGSIIGSVLAVVAMIFTWVVNKRTDKISDRTLQSLDKIETTVAMVSDNTNNLIKAAWEKMLGSVGAPPEADLPTFDTKELAAGIAAEIREDLGLGTEGSSSPDQDQRLSRVEKSLERLEAAVQTRAAVNLRSARMSDLLDVVVPKLRRLSPEAKALIAAIRNYHLTLPQYHGLRSSPLAGALAELRDAGLLAPVIGNQDGRKARVYFIPNGLHNVLEPAFALLPAVPDEARKQVERELLRVGYRQA